MDKLFCDLARTLMFRHKWVLYVHVQSISTTYYTSYVKIADITCVYDFWCVLQNIPTAKDLHSRLVLMNNSRIVAYSLFKEGVTPEWEHIVNMNGCEWGCREDMDSETFAYMWNSLIVAMVNDELDNVVGCRCINKSNKMRKLFKIEIWMDSLDSKDTNRIKQHIDAILRLNIPFSLMLHDDKHKQASEYLNKRKKTKKHTCSKAEV